MVPIVPKRASMVWSVGFLVNTGFPKCIDQSQLSPSVIDRTAQVRRGEEKECEARRRANARKEKGAATLESEK
jgi:hypothetical protein